MSHFTTIKVEIKDARILTETLSELGHKFETNAQVRGYMGDRAAAEYVVRRQDGYDIGFRKRKDDGDESYELIADFSMIANYNKFINELQQKYAHKMLLATAETQGYTIEAEEVMVDGSVRVVVGRWI